VVLKLDPWLSLCDAHLLSQRKRASFFLFKSNGLFDLIKQMIFMNTSQGTEEQWGANDFVKQEEQIIS
jgi:hypothetical protein